jgi:biotin-dependent carboxylase-like uncharacterized protein
VIRVVATGPLSTVQDLGRIGYGHLGVSQSGAADLSSHRLANRLVANSEDAATIEVTMGGLELTTDSPVHLAVTGAPALVLVDGTAAGMNAPIALAAGSRLRLDIGRVGLRSYVAIRGGVDARPILGSRSTDTLSGIGPAPLTRGDALEVGSAFSGLPEVDQAPVQEFAEQPNLRVLPGPRHDWLTDEATTCLVSTVGHVSADSNRVGVRLEGGTVERAGPGEVQPEGLVPGAVQVPPNGCPIVFLADHPVTGGYPVVAVVCAADQPLAAQLRPGQNLTLSWKSPRSAHAASTPSERRLIEGRARATRGG